MKLDVLITTAHPDDAEFSMGGTILKLIAQDKKVGIADFTRGELGTRGTADLRDTEAAEADRRLGLSARVNLQFRDGFFQVDEAHILKLVQVIRRFRPEILFTNPPSDRHPDHERAYLLAREAVFLSGLPKIVTLDEHGKSQEAWRPKRVFHYIQSCQHKPDFIVDIAAFWEGKINTMRAYQSQFHNEECELGDPETIIFHKDFWKTFEARSHALGMEIGAEYGEGFLSEKALKVDDITHLV